VVQLASRAQDIGLASSSEMEALRAAAEAPSSDHYGLLVGFMQQWAERLTGQKIDRAQRLAPQGQTSGVSAPYALSMAWLNNLLGWVLLGAVLTAVLVTGPLYPFFRSKFEVNPQAYFGGAYGSLFLLITATQFCRWAIDQWERWRRRHIAREASGSPWFERWLTRDAAHVDQIIRQQIATELEQGPLADLQEAMRQSHRAGGVEKAQAARELGNGLRHLAQLIRGAAYASTALALDGAKTVQQGARLVDFEEESLRLARIVAARAQELRRLAHSGAETEEQIQQVAEALDTLGRHFANREAILAGMPPSRVYQAPPIPPGLPHISQEKSNGPR
jgi:hypothetical protein